MYLLLVVRIPNSPRWLVIHNNDADTARTLIGQLDPSIDPEEELEAIKKTEKADSGSGFSQEDTSGQFACVLARIF